MNHADEIWKTLVRATVDKKHPWRVVGFATAGPNGPQVRSVILRGASESERQLVFYTDRRSQKIVDLALDARVSLLFWNSRSNSQLRVTGVAAEETDPERVAQLWERIPEYSRKDYATLSAPGQVLQDSETGYDMGNARNNFVVLKVEVQSMELLVLQREGHFRIGLELDAEAHWVENRLVP
ncbi:MAG TPA: pyridoxamine 5'-phosphate oxidase family protein [Limnobacter sp.]|nr:pyridoxamine 5'-phosphate oxidase family protein [Limnobacter sp.]